MLKLILVKDSSLLFLSCLNQMKDVFENSICFCLRKLWLFKNCSLIFRNVSDQLDLSTSFNDVIRKSHLNSSTKNGVESISRILIVKNSFILLKSPKFHGSKAVFSCQQHVLFQLK